MTLIVQAEAPPLRKEAGGALRVGNSRVLLEMVIRAFEDGATAETIVQRFPSLKLPDVYAVIAYYLRHRDEVDDYLLGREKTARQIKERLEKQQDLTAIRKRLQYPKSRPKGVNIRSRG